MATTALTASKTPGIIVAEIRMMSASFSGVHFLVEGDDDSRFWKPRVSSTSVTIVNCEGKPNLLGASALIQRLGISAVAGVYDPDFERLFGVTHHPNILTPTDHNDLELTLIASDALNSLLHEFGDPDLIADFERTHGISVAHHLEATSRQFRVRNSQWTYWSRRRNSCSNTLSASPELVSFTRTRHSQSSCSRSTSTDRTKADERAGCCQSPSHCILAGTSSTVRYVQIIALP